jgi:hypothetical protein
MERNSAVHWMKLVVGFQGILNRRQHQKSIMASKTASVVSKMRRGVSPPSFTGVDDVDTVVDVSFATEVAVSTGVGN